jgi:hypothetical protein
LHLYFSAKSSSGKTTFAPIDLPFYVAPPQQTYFYPLVFLTCNFKQQQGASNRGETPKQQGPKQQRRCKQQQRYPVTAGEGTLATAGDPSNGRGPHQQKRRQKRRELSIKTPTAARTSSTAGSTAKGRFHQCRRVSATQGGTFDISGTPATAGTRYQIIGTAATASTPVGTGTTATPISPSDPRVSRKFTKVEKREILKFRKRQL